MLARRPLVFAERRAAAEAAVLLPPGRVLENVVTEAIANGGMVRRDRPAGTAVVVGEGLEFALKRTRSPLTGRAAWTVSGVTARAGNARVSRVAGYSAEAA